MSRQCGACSLSLRRGLSWSLRQQSCRTLWPGLAASRAQLLLAMHPLPTLGGRCIACEPYGHARCVNTMPMPSACTSAGAAMHAQPQHRVLWRQHGPPALQPPDLPVPRTGTKMIWTPGSTALRLVLGPACVDKIWRLDFARHIDPSTWLSDGIARTNRSKDVQLLLRESRRLMPCRRGRTRTSGGACSGLMCARALTRACWRQASRALAPRTRAMSCAWFTRPKSDSYSCLISTPDPSQQPASKAFRVPIGGFDALPPHVVTALHQCGALRRLGLAVVFRRPCSSLSHGCHTTMHGGRCTGWLLRGAADRHDVKQEPRSEGPGPEPPDPEPHTGALLIAQSRPCSDCTLP